MRKSAVTLVTAVFACLGAGQVSAAERMSDVAFLTAMRCQGLAEGRQMNAASLEASMKTQKRGRELYISDRAKRARQDGARDGGSASVGRKAQVDAELNGVCQAYLGGGAALAGAPNAGG